MISFSRKYLLLLVVLLFVSLQTITYGQCNFTKGQEGELCSTAKYICGSELDGYTGTLRDTNNSEYIWPGSNNGICPNGAGHFDNTSWFSFTACSRTVHLRIIFNNCVHPTNNLNESGMQAGLFAACQPNSIVICDEIDKTTSGVLDLQYNNFVPGQLVYFVLDGYARSVCDFTIQVLSGLDTSPVTPPDASLLGDGAITGPNIIQCDEKNSPIAYNLLEPERKVNFSSSCTPPNNFNPADSVCYAWSIFPINGRQFQNQDSTGKSINIIYTEPGTYTIYAETFFNPYYVGSCANVAAGKILSWTVTVLPPVKVINQPEFICPGNTRLFCGQLISKDTTIICNADPCRIVTQEFKFGNSKLNIMGTQYVCLGTSFPFQGVNYQPGQYEVIDLNDCSLLHRFTIEEVVVDANILTQNRTLDCNNRTITLNGIGTTNGINTLTYEWKDTKGNIISKSKDLTIDKRGEYTLSVSYSTMLGICTDDQMILISDDFGIPQINSTPPTIRCLKAGESAPFINITSTDPTYTYEWTSPKGQKSYSKNIIVDSTNAITGRPYLLTIRSNNGCTLDTSFLVPSNFQKAVIQMSGDDLTCFHPIQTINATTDIPIDSIRWSKVSPDFEYYGDFTGNIANLSYAIGKPGVYKLEVMASSSKCWNYQTTPIAQDTVRPDLTLNSDVKWHCDTKTINLEPQASSGNHISYNWSTTGGQILSDDKNKDIIVGSTGIYQILVFDEQNGCKKSGIVNIIHETDTPTEILVDAQDVSCFGQKDGIINILNTIGGFGPYTYYNGNTKLSNLTINDLAPGNYIFTVKDAYECEQTVNVTIDEPEVLTVETDPIIEIDFSEKINLSFVSNYQDDQITSVKWFNSTSDLIGTGFTLDYLGEIDDLITVEVTTEKGCFNRSKIIVDVDNELKIFIPNIFSPNGDGINDFLEIYKNKIPTGLSQIAIYDRFGNRVFNKSGHDFENQTLSWDGYFHGQPLVPGVYIMLIELTDHFGKSHIIKQDITIVK